jgi:hypothetical protein
MKPVCSVWKVENGFIIETKSDDPGYFPDRYVANCVMDLLDVVSDLAVDSMDKDWNNEQKK